MKDADWLILISYLLVLSQATSAFYEYGPFVVAWLKSHFDTYMETKMAKVM